MKPKCLNRGDKVAIVSLSSGVLGESFVAHELKLAEKRLREFGLEPVYMPNSLKGISYLNEHPEARAEDLKKAFADKDIKGIICAIGGDDTYRLAPYLMDDQEFINNVKSNPKLFTGFSDTTVDHLMLNKLGLNTFYGPNVVCDLAELDKDMLSYTKDWFEVYLGKDKKEVESSPVWYLERTDFSPNAVGSPREARQETHGYETLLGGGVREGKLWGGCIDSLYTLAFSEAKKPICDKYNLMPSLDELKSKMLFIETSDNKPLPEEFERILTAFKDRGIFDVVCGIIAGKPQDETYYDEYKEIFKKVLTDKNVPVLYNVNFGHATPRCVVPYNITCRVDYDKKTITYLEDLFEK